MHDDVLLQHPGAIVALSPLWLISSNLARFMGALNKCYLQRLRIRGFLFRDFMLMLFNCSKISGCLFITDMRM